MTALTVSSGTPDEALVQVHNQSEFASSSTLDNTPALVIPFSDREPDCFYDGVSDDASVPILNKMLLTQAMTIFQPH